MRDDHGMEPGRTPHEMQHVGDGTHWEAAAGYSRAVRVGDQIHVSGTTGGDGDTYAQATSALRRGLDAIERLGGGTVVRSRVYLTPDAVWEDAARAHLELLGDAKPANTMLFVHALIGAELLVEVELDAVSAGG